MATYTRGKHPNSRKKPKYDLDELLRSGKRNENGCLIWPGATQKGYGAVNRDGMVRVHRLVYEKVIGVVPDGHDVCHTCDVRSCFEPTHLFAGTRKENMQDCVRKGRHPSQLRSKLVHAANQTA